MEWPRFRITVSLAAIEHYWIVVVDHVHHRLFGMRIRASRGFIIQTTNMSATTLSHWPGPNVDMMELQWHTISTIVPSLGHFTSSLNAGLNGTTLYDTVQADGATGNATVDATIFRAECGLLRNSELSYTPKLNANQFGDYVIEPQVTGLERTLKWQGRL
ncbi:hypothetical protein P692DRAFT_20296620, partial [Suillus brevipes Sb2]